MTLHHIQKLKHLQIQASKMNQKEVKIDSKKLTDAEKYKRLRKMKNNSSMKHRQKKIKIIKNLEIDLGVQEEKNWILQMNYDSLLQKINDVKIELELIIKLCPECNNISWTIDDLIY